MSALLHYLVNDLGESRRVECEYRVKPIDPLIDSIDLILEDYPNITREDVDAALEFASCLSNYQASAYEAVA